jgi:hypothetical protein
MLRPSKDTTVRIRANGQANVGGAQPLAAAPSSAEAAEAADVGDFCHCIDRPSAVTIESAIQTSPFTQHTFHQVPARFRPTTVICVPALS